MTSKSENNKEERVRDCSDYYNEYKACTSLANKIQTYYAFGYFQKKEDCYHWKEMLNLCKKCTEGDDQAAKQTLLAMEKANADEIIGKRATIWTYRDKPPRMWHFPGKLKLDFESEKPE